MNDYTLVMNAGSSSLKFSVYQRSTVEEWRLGARGQIEGIGTAPRFVAKDESGATIADQALGRGVGDARAALDALASWLRGHYRRPNVLGVGHRVVHGGARYAKPTVVTNDVLDYLHQLVPLAPLHQPHNLAAIDAVAELLPGVPQVACFDTAFHRGPARGSPNWCRFRWRSGAPVFSAMAFTGLSYEYIASVLPRFAHEIADGRVIVAHLGSWRQPVRAQGAQEHRQHLRVHRARRPLHGDATGRRGSRASFSILFRRSGFRRKTSRPCSTRSPGCWASPASATTCANCWPALMPDARLAVDYFVYRASREIGALATAAGGIDALVFTAGIGEKSAEIRRRICESASWLGIALDESANARHELRITHPHSAVSAWVIPTERGVDDRAPYLGLVGNSGSTLIWIRETPVAWDQSLISAEVCAAR
jgi:acetate kinase